MKPVTTVNIEEYLSPDFRPELKANQLIRETTTARDTNVDVSPALTKLQYDIDEIDTRIEALCQENHEALLSHALRTSEIADKVTQLRPAIDDVNSAVAKLNRDFLDPYNAASDLHSSGEKLHQLAVLARSLSWYLQLALQAKSEDYKRENLASIEGPVAAMLRNAHAIKTMAKLVVEVPKLSQITCVIQFRQQIPSICASIGEAATEVVKKFSGGSNNQIRMALLTLKMLDLNIEQIVDQHCRSLVGNSVLQLTRGAGTSIDYEIAFSETFKRAESVETLRSTLQEIVPADQALTPNSSSTPHFWDALATQIDQKLRVLSVTNQTALKSLIANQEVILSSAQSVPQLLSVYTKYINK